MQDFKNIDGLSTEYLTVAAVFLLSAGLTWLQIRYATNIRLLSHPNRRSSHSTPTPTSGGWSFIIVFCLFSLPIILVGGIVFAITGYVLVLALLVALVGYYDDMREVSAIARLSIHFLVSICLLWLCQGLPALHLLGVNINGGALLYVTYTFCLVWLINLFNFMDGIDGIAGIEAASVLIGASVILWVAGSGEWTGFLVLLALAVSGFLVFNWPPAKIFMGDAGSGFLGFMLGAFALLTAADGVISLWSWMILLAVFVADATITLLRRAMRGERVYEAHRSHAYQILSRRWNSHQRVTLLVLAVNLFWLWPIAWVATNWPQQGWLLAGVAYLPLVVVAYMTGAGTTND